MNGLTASDWVFLGMLAVIGIGIIVLNIVVRQKNKD